LRNVFTELRLTPSVSTGITYTDNVDFEADARDDLILFLRPRVTLIARARRLNTALDYGFSAEYSTDEEGFRIEQLADSELRSANTFEIVDDIVFLEANALVSREIVDNTVTTPAGIESEQTENFATVQRYQLRPLVQNRFDDFLISETRGQLGFVNTGDDDDEGWTQTYGISQAFLSGPRFTTYQWGWNTEYVVSRSGGDDEDLGFDEDDDDDFTRFTTVLDTEVVVSREFSLLGSVGFERIEEETLSEEPDGLIWSVGFAVRPNQRLSASATYGRRFEDDIYSFDMRYEITERSIFQARFDRTLETEETLFLNDLSFLGVDQQGNFVDTRTGLPLREDVELFGLEDEVFFTDRFTADLNLVRGRNRYTFDAFFEEREIQRIGDESETETVWGGGARWERQLSRDMTGTLSVDYRFADFSGVDEGREDDLITFRSGLRRNLGQGFTGSFNYVFRQQISTFETEDATENAVNLTITKTF
jgi:uncharacterized protein (PEP-CTERM system associated)